MTAEPVRAGGAILTRVVPRRRAQSPFGVVQPGPDRRRPTDVVRMLMAIVAVVATAIGAHRLAETEKRIFALVVGWPAWVHSAALVCYRLTAFGTTIAVVAGLVLGRRFRIVGALVASGAIGAVVAMAIGAWVDSASVRSAAGIKAYGVVPEYPLVTLACVTSVLLLALPYLVRPARRVLNAALAIAAFSAFFAVSALPDDIVGALAIGWGVAAALHLVFGSPAADPSLQQVSDALAGLGVNVVDVGFDDQQVWGESRFTAVGPDGDPVVVQVIGRDAADARLFAKVWRSIWYKDSGPSLALTREQQLEHRAYLLLLAARSGVPVSEVVTAGVSGATESAVLVLREPEGQPLPVANRDLVTDDVLGDAWRNLALLHDAHIAHGSMRAGNVLLCPDRTTAFVDFVHASTDTSVERRALDAAGLLSTTAALTGNARAITAARRALGDDGLDEVSRLLTPAALPAPTRHELPDAKALLSSLRADIAAMTRTPVEQAVELRRVSPGSLLMAAGALLGVYLLIGELAGIDFSEVFSGAQWGWIAVAFLLSPLPQFTGSIALMGAVAAPLAFKPVLGEQFANNFTGLVGGTVANTALVIRFFQKQGQAVAVAVSSGVLVSIAAGTIQVIVVVVGLLLTADQFTPSSAGGRSAAGVFLLLLVVGVLVACFLIFIPRIRTRVKRIVSSQWAAARDNLAGILGNPRKAVMLFGGNLGSQILFALVLEASLHAYGESLPLLQLMVINSLASVLGGMAPVPGGMGVVEAGLIAGLTAAGIPQEEAVAATFTHRLFTAYLPPIWGWFALQWLRRSDYV